jgi:hypothetical protein
MIRAGYMYKQVKARPAWLKDAVQVVEVHSVSGCISENFGDYAGHWRHNGFWLFDDPTIIAEIASIDGVDLAPLTCFYYEADPQEFNMGIWSDYSYGDFPTNVTVPQQARLSGYDVVCFTQNSGPECSPLSCNSICGHVSVNRHCLFDTLEQARHALQAGHFANAEPGPYRILAVYTVAR